LSGRAVRKHLAAAFHYLLGHHSAAAAYAPLSMESRDHDLYQDVTKYF
jgi:hypothetical protein